MSPPLADWDAATYHRVSAPQFAWGKQVLADLPLTGKETVLDAGCGSGRLTAELLARLPAGKVLAVDSSPAMLEKAREVLADAVSDGRVTLLAADLQALGLEQVADVVFSTATFHWVLDHERLFASVHAALRPGGRLWAQCGAEGNLSRVEAHAHALAQSPRYASSFASWTEPHHFASVDASRERLLRLGFVDVEVSRVSAPAEFESAQALEEFLRAVVLRPFLSCLPKEEQPEFAAEVTRRRRADAEGLTLDYWRLNLRARRH